MKKLLWVGGMSAFALSLIAVAGVVAADNIDDLGGNIFDTVSVDLKVNGQDGPVTVAAGSRIVVSWISEGAARCRGNWSRNDIKSSGTIAGRISKSVVIKAACIDKEGNRDDDSVVVNVSGQAQIAPQSTTLPNTNTSETVAYKQSLEARFIQSGSVLLERFSKSLADIRTTLKSDAQILRPYDQDTDLYVTEVRKILDALLFNLRQQLSTVSTKAQIDVLDREFDGLFDRVIAKVNESREWMKQKYAQYVAPTAAAQPTLVSVSPESGSSGTRIILTGTGFKSTAKVNLCGTEYPPSSIAPDGTSLSFVVSDDFKTKASLCTIYVTNKDGTYTNQDKTFRVILATPTTTAPTSTTTFPITVDLKVNSGGGFTDGPITVAAGTAIALSYTTTGKIEQCTGDISGDSSASIRTVANTTKTYAVTCTQDGGTGTASDTVTVNITQEAPTIVVPPSLSATAPTISGTRTAAGDKLYPGQMSITATISNSGGQLTTPISARFQYSPNNGANWYDFQEVGPVSTTPRNVTHSWEGGSGSFCFRLAIGTGTDNVSSSSCIEIIPKEGAFIGLSREFAAVAVPDSDVWAFIKAWLGR